MFVIYNLEKNEKNRSLGGKDSEEADVRRASSRTNLTQHHNSNARGGGLQSRKNAANPGLGVVVALVVLLGAVLVVVVVLLLAVLGLGRGLGGDLLGNGLGLLRLG